jgi:transcriptional regulator with XRE-family HTH domain
MIMGTIMTADELRASIKAIGWKGSDLARKVGVGTSTVSRWLNGEPVPLWVDSYLAAMGEIARLHQTFILPTKPTASPAAPRENTAPLRGRAAALVKQSKAEPDLFESKK